MNHFAHMPSVSVWYEDGEVHPLPNETVLDALLRAGMNTPFSCKGGACHTCLLQCVEGEVPSQAQPNLSDDLRAKNYFLPCMCVAVSDMRVQRPQPHDMVTRCMLIEASGHDTGRLHIQFEAAGNFKYRTGQIVHLVMADAHAATEPRIMLTGDPEAPFVEALWVLRPDEQMPAFFAPDAEFGVEFHVRGPFNADYDEVSEMPMPGTDPGLWEDIGEKRIRAVLETFYTKVYADAQLAPFFRGVTKEHIVGKQYSFLQRAFTGRNVYWGDLPRNTHHWMVISHALLDHRQQLMDDAQREHGLTEEQMRRWNRYEEYFRSDIVKGREWPRRIGDQLVNLNGFEEAVLDVGTVCDSCGGEVPTGSKVTTYRRTGRIVSCPHCATADALVAA